jgi:ABC-type transport system involved in multi-copper enzyme maturation permease subunit
MTTATQRDTSQPLPFAQAARGVFDLSLEGMIWSRRSLLMAVLIGLPLLFALLFRAITASGLTSELRTVHGFDLYGVLVTFYYVRNALPLVALFYATSLIADEIEGRTITYLLTRPIQRAAILFGKFAAYLATTLTLTLPPLLISFFLLGGDGGVRALAGHVPDLLTDMGVCALTLLAYGALFTLLGVLLRRPVIPGLLFLFIWELVANLPGYMPRFTLTAYLRSLLSHRPPAEGPAELFGQKLPALLCLETLSVTIVVLLAAAAWVFSRREYVLEQ